MSMIVVVLVAGLFFSSAVAQLTFTRYVGSFSPRSQIQFAYAPNITFYIASTGAQTVWTSQTMLVTDQRADLLSFTNSNDVWASSDLANWQLISGVGQTGAAYPPYNASSYPSSNGAATAYSYRRDLWVRISGQYGATNFTSFVYSSTNAITWNFVSSPPQFTGRTLGQAAFDSHDRLFYIGGIKQYGGSAADVFMSLDYGATWSVRTYGAAFGGHDSFGFTALRGLMLPGQPDILIISCGYNGVSAAYNDVWTSSDQGLSWARISGASSSSVTTTTNPFTSTRDSVTMLTTSENAIIMTDGTSPGNVWASLDGGYNFRECNPTGYWGTRWQPNAVLSLDNHLVFGGGAASGSNTAVQYNDVWRSDQVVSVANLLTLCTNLTMPPCGVVGLQCWPTAVDTVITSLSFAYGFNVSCNVQQTCSPSTALPPQATYMPFTRTTQFAPWPSRTYLSIAYFPSVTFTDTSAMAHTFTSQTLMVAGIRQDVVAANSNDVWASSDLANWYLIAGQVAGGTTAYGSAATSSFYSSSGACVAYNAANHLWVRVGGLLYNATATTYSQAVYSTTDGINWVFVGNAVNVSARAYAECVFTSQNQLVLVGGYNAGFQGSTFISPDYGVTWIQQTTSEQFGTRQAIGLAAHPTILSSNDILYASNGYGGSSSAQYNDVSLDHVQIIR
jgi:hypothetical protein